MDKDRIFKRWHELNHKDVPMHLVHIFKMAFDTGYSAGFDEGMSHGYSIGADDERSKNNK
jgi:hypothetical protein